MKLEDFLNKTFNDLNSTPDYADIGNIEFEVHLDWDENQNVTVTGRPIIKFHCHLQKINKVEIEVIDSK